MIFAHLQPIHYQFLRQLKPEFETRLLLSALNSPE